MLDIIEHEQPDGVIIQVGGQTALKLGKRLVKAGKHIFGTEFQRIDFAEDRGAFSDLLIRLNIPFPEYGTATDVQGALNIADRIGYPVLIRPSYVLGGQGMRIAVKQEELERYVANILKTHPENAFLIDKYLEHAIEVDVDSVYDGTQLHIAGMMQHIEPAMFGDSNIYLHSLQMKFRCNTKISRAYCGSHGYSSVFECAYVKDDKV